MLQLACGPEGTCTRRLVPEVSAPKQALLADLNGFAFVQDVQAPTVVDPLGASDASLLEGAP